MKMSTAYSTLWSKRVAPNSHMSTHPSSASFAYARSDAMPLRADSDISALGCSEGDDFVVVAPLTWEVEKPLRATSSGMWQDVALDDDKILCRSTRMLEIIDRLEQALVLMIASRPKTGKSTMARLIGNELKYRSTKNQVFFYISFRTTENGAAFGDIIKQQCDKSWKEVKKRASEEQTVYLIADDAQDLPPNHQSTGFWRLVQELVDKATTGIRVLIVVNPVGRFERPWNCPVNIPIEQTLGMEDLAFNSNEMCEYVTKWFNGFTCFDDADMRRFCALLQLFTDGHVGLCVVVIRALNMLQSLQPHAPFSALEWIDMIQHGKVLNMVITTPTFSGLGAFCSKDIVQSFERLLCGVDIEEDQLVRDYSVYDGILVRRSATKDVNFHDFFMPVMWRYFVQTRLDHVERTTVEGWTTLQDLILQSLRAIDFSTIRYVSYGNR